MQIVGIYIIPVKIYLILPWWLKRFILLVSPLLELTPGFAYFLGLRPLLKRVSIESVRLNSKMVQGANLSSVPLIK